MWGCMLVEEKGASPRGEAEQFPHLSEVEVWNLRDVLRVPSGFRLLSGCHPEHGDRVLPDGHPVHLGVDPQLLGGWPQGVCAEQGRYPVLEFGDRRRHVGHLTYALDVSRERDSLFVGDVPLLPDTAEASVRRTSVWVFTGVKGGLHGRS